MLFFAIVKIRISDGYGHSGEIFKKLHTVEAASEQEARTKIENFWKEKDSFSNYHDIIELEISEHLK